MTTVRFPRPAIAFVAWTAMEGRAREIALALGGVWRTFHSPRMTGPRLAPLRYGVHSVLTAAYLARVRPLAVIVSNPPIFPGLIAYLYGLVARVPVVLDSHPGSFGVKGDRVGALFLPVHRWLVRRVAATMVTTEVWADTVRAWGGRPIVAHDAPPSWHVVPAKPIGDSPRVLFVGVFGDDEPFPAVIEAAALTPSIEVRITGDVRKCPAELRAGAPGNVQFVGFLQTEKFRDEVEAADVILSLTTEPTSIMRSAYEAVYARRPLVTTDWPALRATFPYAIHVANGAEAIADGMRRAIAEHEMLRQSAEAALSLQAQRWEQQLNIIKSHIVARRKGVGG